MFRVVIETIEHKYHRYSTLGDFFGKPEKMTIRVTAMGNWKYEFLIALHEYVESQLCREMGISHQTIDRWDMNYEKKRKPGDNSEPGEHPKCPYRKAHFSALAVEMFVATQLGVDWVEYEKACNRMFA